MPVLINDKGSNNRVDLHPWFQTHGMLRIVFNGSDNIVSIPDPPLHCRGALMELGEGCAVTLAGGCGLMKTHLFAARRCTLQLGAGTTLHHKVRFMMHEPADIVLGSDCMVASDVQFLTSDNHTIFDATTKQRINPAGSIHIGDHVWLGLQTVILKGATVGSGSIVGLRAVVSGSIPENCMAAGVPARVVRENVSWDRKLIEEWPAPLA